MLYTQKPDAFCLASSDADFTPLVMQLKANGHEVYGFGERKTPMPFVNACTTFLYLDGLDDPEQVAPVEPAAKPETAAKATGKPKVASGKAEETAGNPLTQDTALMTILRGAVEASAHDDGWAAMSAAGSAAKRQAPIDPRNYGVKNFTALFAATGLFEVVKMENGQAFVADRRNADRAPKPVR